MKKMQIGLGLVLIVLLLYVLYILTSTGFFRKIEYHFEGNVVQSIPIPGVEDIQVSTQDTFILFSSDDRASRRDGQPKQGHLYYMDLRDTTFKPVQLTQSLDFPFYPHGISMIRTNEKEYRVYVVNHVDDQHSIECFSLYGDSLVHTQTLRDETMISPNDIVALEGGRFYFTNDHGYTKGIMKLGEEYLGWAVSNVVYFDGQSYREVADGIVYANGINFDAARNLLFVASPRGFLVKTYEVASNGDLTFVENIDCGTGVDNIEFDSEGKIWIGCHPNLLKFAAYEKGRKLLSPSEIITIDYRSKGDYAVQSVYLDEGYNISASTVAAVYNNLVFVGSVFDGHFLVLSLNNSPDSFSPESLVPSQNNR